MDDSRYKEVIEYCQTDDFTKIENHRALVSDLKEMRDERGRNLLMVAAFHHSYKVVEMLLDMGFDINATNNKGTSVFMYAKTKVLENGNYGFLEMLINRGADIHRRDFYNKTVFDYVSELGNKQMTMFLNRFK